MMGKKHPEDVNEHTEETAFNYCIFQTTCRHKTLDSLPKRQNERQSLKGRDALRMV